ncbi:transcriptional regulator [Clostridia bacterium]|nr:transcriptional regulator [Clostridia bacterium]
MTIADRIQHLRKSKGISQEELADKIGVSRQAVSKWESEQSFPEMDKIIIMSDFFDITTDYILKGIEPEKQAAGAPTNAIIFVAVATALNFIGLIVSCAIWYEQQVPMATVIGLIIMAVGCMVFVIGVTGSTLNKDKGIRCFWTVNIWLLTFIPLSCIYNMLLSRSLAPYPLLAEPLIAFALFWLIYIAGCTVAVLATIKRSRRV